jgi:hypothetical protein
MIHFMVKFGGTCKQLALLFADIIHEVGLAQHVHTSKQTIKSVLIWSNSTVNGGGGTMELDRASARCNSKRGRDGQRRKNKVLQIGRTFQLDSCDAKLVNFLLATIR